jgi:cell division protease FtsH
VRRSSEPPPPGSGRFWVTYPKNDVTTSELIGDLTASGARVTVDPQPAKATVRVLLTVLLPLMILANLFALFFSTSRGASTALGEVVSFGQIGKRRVGKAQKMVTFADVAGLDEAIVELREVVEYLRQPERHTELGAAPPKGILLFGPPGCGKTLLAKAVAGEAEVPFFSVAGAEFVESLVGVGAARVRDLFLNVRAVAPAIVFIDELDAAGRRRSSAGGGSEERDQTLNQLLVEMDGFEVASGIVVMAATNRPDILDPALLRPGRFDRHISIQGPDVERREAILRLHASSKPVAPGVDFGQLARHTSGFSGADLANVVNEAVLLTIRAGTSAVTAAAFSEAVQRVLAGPQRRGHLLDEEERRRVACHEAGHALAAAAFGREVHRVSIVARGRRLGGVGVEREEEGIATRSDLLHRLVIDLAGVAAEELMLEDPSTGAEDDLEAATSLARDLVGRFGMSPAMGRVRLLAQDADAGLGPEPVLRPLAPSTHAAFDAEMRRLLDEAHARATALLARRRRHLEVLVERLLVEETLEGPRLASLLPPPEPSGDGVGTGQPAFGQIQ